MRNALVVVLALGTVVTVGHAQSMAEVTDQLMVMQMGMETDTMEMHTISANGRSRADTHTRGGMLAQMWGANSSQIMNPRDSAMGMIIVNHDKKTYSTLDFSKMFDSSGNILGGAGGNVKIDPSEDSSSVDSLGPGPVIAGHATLHFRTRSISHMTMAFMGQNATMRSEMTSDLFIAPDIRTEGDSSKSARMQSLFGPGMMARAGNKIGRATSEIAKKGTTLRMATETVIHIGEMTQTQRMSVETLSYKRMVVPDSVFAIPAGYTRTEGFFGMPPG